MAIYPDLKKSALECKTYLLWCKQLVQLCIALWMELKFDCLKQGLTVLYFCTLLYAGIPMTKVNPSAAEGMRARDSAMQWKCKGDRPHNSLGNTGFS